MAEPAEVVFDAPTGWRLVGRYGLLIAVAVIVLFPIYTTVISAFKPANKVLSDPLIPNAFTLDLIREAWTSGHLGRYLLNSAIVAFAVTALQLVTSVLSAYAFALLDFPGRNALFVVFLATLLVPAETTIIVNHKTVQWLGWINTYQGLVIPFAATAFGTFLLRQAFMTLPRDLRDAAEIDGVGHLGFLRHVAVPLVRPTIAALGLFSFLGSWNQYLWPRFITTDPSMNTVQSGLAFLKSQMAAAPNLVMAGTLIAAVPIVIVLLVFQKHLIRGLTAGAVKG